MKQHRLAIIGTGNSVNNHLTAIKEMGERVELVAAVDVDETRVKQICAEHQIPQWYTNAEAMLAAVKPDLVHIVTPPATHLELIVQCLEAGAWVYCEKPLCASLAEYDQIEAAQQRTGRYVVTVFQWRFGSAVRHLRGLMATESLGKPLIGLCQTMWYRDAQYYQAPWRGKWATELGGPTMSLGIHLMDLFLWLMGDWQTVQAQVATLDRQIEVEDVSMALVQFENGALGSITNSALSPRQETYMRLDFQKATVEVKTLYRYSNTHWQINVADHSPYEHELAIWRNIGDDVGGKHEAQLETILNSLDNGTPPPLNGKEGRRTLEFIASLYKSAFTQQAVERGMITTDDPFYYAMNGKPLL